MSESMMVKGSDRIAENSAIPQATPIQMSSAGRGGLLASQQTEAIVALVIGFVVFTAAVLVLMYRTDARR